ncbi:MAG: metallophosphoesterase [candidate division WOR-3 bacterium]|nr:metallophosphoesterase [candidate division WOR-3 bacterium]
MTRTQRPARFGWSPWVVGIALLCAAAPAVIVEDDYETGSGPYFFRIALIADPHNKYDNLRAARDTINSLASNPSYNMEMVIVLGDLSSAATYELDSAKSILDGLAVPYVPLTGNHDIVPWDAPARDEDSLFTTRCFDRTFGSVYDAMADSMYPEVRDFRRYEEHPWNFQIVWPGDTHAYDIWQNFSFRAGPELSPYRFVCLDFNQRKSTGQGAWPGADLQYLPFDNRTSSIRARGGTQPPKCVVFVDDSLRGDSLPISFDTSDLGTFGNRISSVWVNEGVTVDLYDAANFAGDTWLRLTATDSDLDINGSAQWWRDYVKAYYDSVVNDTIRENVIFFAHNPLMAVDPFGIGNFDPDEVNAIASFLAPYACDVGGWYAGHLNDSAPLIRVPGHGRVRNPVDGSKVCDWYMPPASEFYGGWVKILTLHYGREPLVDVDHSGMIDDTVDVTHEDTIPVIVTTLRLGLLTARIQKGSLPICTLVESLPRGPGRETDTLAWDGRDSSGARVVPGDDFTVRYYDEEGFFTGLSPFTVMDTSQSACAEPRDTRDMFHEPRGVSITPNPFSRSVAVVWNSPARSGDAARVYAQDGGLVRQAQIPAGEARWVWDGKDSRGGLVPPGVYVLVAPGGVRAKAVKLR